MVCSMSFLRTVDCCIICKTMIHLLKQRFLTLNNIQGGLKDFPEERIYIL
ncbi:hypothetical protein CLOHYLEM_05353 [[Clostridium] hylemonae DSM 15053]|uniref:Uncharacterized protein n=1 Tax=[Clostridium] hylemonae DSM 15053 TaxID=553973 RepID=C0BZW1_9FIRM|nr:hypothetical protein CLOHYLEM_05353 [[Clostridium] hylemonae DSM 15053]